MVTSEYEKKITGWFLVFCVCLMIGITIYQSKQHNDAMRGSEIIPAVVTKTYVSRSSSDVYVRYTYKNKVFNYSFGFQELGKMKKGKKILIKVSKKYPEKYIEFYDMYDEEYEP